MPYTLKRLNESEGKKASNNEVKAKKQRTSNMEASIANVNKNKKESKKSNTASAGVDPMNLFASSEELTIKRNNQKESKEVPYSPSTAKRGNVQSQSRSKSVEPESEQGINEMMVSSMEEDQVFETHVQKGNESYCESSDEEIDFDKKDRNKNSQTMEQSDGEIEELDFEGNDRPPQPQAEIEQIDKEMEEKLRKLHEVMTSKNMNRSAGVIEQCLEACQDNQAKMKTKGKAKVSQRILTQEDHLVNENSNATKSYITKQSIGGNYISSSSIEKKQFIIRG